MICHKCGNPEIKEEDNFCVACGAKLKKTCNCWVIKKRTTIVEKVVVQDTKY